MVVQLSNLKDTVNKAIEKATSTKEAVLASHTIAIDYIKPSQFFHNGEELFLGERFYWKNADNTKILVGQGLAYTFQSSEAKPLLSVEKKWKRLNKVVVTEEDVKGEGPLLFGGIAFDDHMEHKEAWSPFAQGLFYVPQFMLAISADDKATLTINICLQGNEHVDQVVAKLKKMENQLFTTTDKVMEGKPDVTIQRVDQQAWMDQVNDVVERIASGEAEKVVLARPVEATFTDAIHVTTIIERLSVQQSNSYVFVLEALDRCFIGATPERLVVKNNKEVKSTCLAGSISRGSTEERDEALGSILLNDGKNRKEHAYVVKTIQRAFDQLCSSVYLPEEPTLLKMKDIQHLYTPVIGTVSGEHSVLSFVQMLHPTPALGGEPVESAMAIIREVEQWDRGFYGAPIGYVDEAGDGEFAVAIRSALVTNAGKTAYLFAGCGVVDSSDAKEEWEETELKLRPMKRALTGDEWL